MSILTTGDVEVNAPLYNVSDAKSKKEKIKKELRAHSLYNEILKMMHSLLGKEMTYGGKLQSIARELIGSNVGVSARDEFLNIILESDREKAYYIVNTDTIDLPGTHWMLVYQDGNNLYFYDSFGRKWKDMIPELSKVPYFKIKNFDTSDREQKMKQTDCGPRVLAIALLIKHFGIETALLV